MSTLPDALAVIDEVGRDNVGIVVDTWHLWGTDGFLEHLRSDTARILGVQVCDVRAETRSWCDRVLPGDGIVDWRAILDALDGGGYTGWSTSRDFSDDGTFAEAFPDLAVGVARRPARRDRPGALRRAGPRRGSMTDRPTDAAAAPLRWAIVGTGWAGSRVADALARMPDARLTSVVSRDPGRGAAFAREQGGEASSPSLAACFERARPASSTWAPRTRPMPTTSRKRSVPASTSSPTSPSP